MESLRRLRDDVSVSSIAAGLISVLVGMTSSAILVFQAARAGGATAEGAGSWLGSLCVAMGILSIVLSLRYQTPVLIAWSTAGSALLITGLPAFTPAEAVGSFVFSAALILFCGATGLFERLMDRIPVPIASGLLAGVLLHFSLDAFSAFKTQPLLVGAMFALYLVGRRFWGRLTMLGVLVGGTALAAAVGLFHFGEVSLTATRFEFVAPAFSWRPLVGLGIPLFVVTMASQNLTGITVMRANGYATPLSPLLTVTGAANLLTAPFGGFSLNLAAITAAIAMGPESHPLPRKRYVSGVVSGALYLLIGLAAGTVASLFAAFPTEMIAAIAGLALLSTIAGSLLSAILPESEREAAFITFAVSASGLTYLGIGSAFWGLIAGAVTHFLLRRKN